MVVNIKHWNLASGKVLYFTEKLTSTTQMQNRILWWNFDLHYHNSGHGEPAPMFGTFTLVASLSPLNVRFELRDPNLV